MSEEEFEDGVLTGDNEAFLAELAEQAQAFFMSIMNGDYCIEDGYPDLGGWTNYAAQVVDAYREAYHESGEDRIAAQKAASLKYRELIRTEKRLLTLMSAREHARAVEPVQEAAPPPTFLELMPPLAPEAQLDYSLGRDVCGGWYDNLVEWSVARSPISYRGHIEGIVLWIMSTVAARRIVLHYAKPTYTPLLIALVGRSSVWAKSTALRIAKNLFEQSGLDYLLLDTDPTPAAFWLRLSGIVPENYAVMSPEEKERIALELAFAAQHGWIYDEFGAKLDAMLNEKSPYADFHRILRVIDDCEGSYAPETIVRGVRRVRNPYLALLAGLTPKDLRKHAKRGASIWTDGTLGRIGLSYAYLKDGEEPPYGEPPLGRLIVPGEYVRPLAEWHHRLGVPRADIRATNNDKIPYAYEPIKLPETELFFGKGAREAHSMYFKTLRTMSWRNKDNDDLDSTYSRLPELALRIAMLFASFEASPTVNLSHYARAQQIAESWRASAHELYSEINTPDPSETVNTEARIMRQFVTKGWLTPRDLAGPCGIDTVQARSWCENLYIAGALMRERTQSGTYRYARPGTPPKERKGAKA